MNAARALGVASVVAAVGCSGSSAGPSTSTGALDCAWLAGDNCLKASLTDGMSCVPPTAETGSLSADNKTCTYASGVTITFDSPLQLPLPTDASPPWHFTIARAGTECLRFESTDNDNFELVVNGGTLTQTLPRPASTNLTITCPDGAAYSNANALSLLSCDQVGLISQGWGSTDTTVSLDLLLYGFDGPPLHMFDCAR